MKVIAINGSPRKNRNTAQLLKSALDGAESVGAKTELIHLYDLNFKGCISCFACKRVGSKCNGLCAVNDDAKPVLEKILGCDALLLGSPIYFGNVTGEMRSFIERLIFPNLSYDVGKRSVFRGSLNSAFIYTMNVTQESVKTIGYNDVFNHYKNLLQILNGDSEFFASTDTYQFDDYSLYHASRYDALHKAKVKDTQFPKDLDAVFSIGARLGNG